MKAEHISIALSLEQVPNIGHKTARLLRQAGIDKPADLMGVDAYQLYDKICQITHITHSLKLLDVLLSAVDFASGGAPRPWSDYSETRKLTMLKTR